MQNEEFVLPLPVEKIKLNNLIMLQNILIAGFLGGYEWIIILFAIVLLFGGKKIPELMRGLGKGIKEFKESSKEIAGDTEKNDSKTAEEK